MLNKLIQKDDYGNFGIKGLPWESLYIGRIITPEVYEKIYGCIFKLMEYEDSGLDPDQVVDLVDKLNSSGR